MNDGQSPAPILLSAAQNLSPHSMSCPEAKACCLSLSACWGPGGPAPGGGSPWQPRGRLGGFSEESETDGDARTCIRPCPPRCSSARVSELRHYKVVPVLAKLLCCAVLRRRESPNLSPSPVDPTAAARLPLAIPAHPHPPTPQRRTRNGLAGIPLETVTLAVRCLRG